MTGSLMRFRRHERGTDAIPFACRGTPRAYVASRADRFARAATLSRSEHTENQRQAASAGLHSGVRATIVTHVTQQL